MTRREFYQYLLSQNCTVVPLRAYHLANQVEIISPTGEKGYLDLPIDGRSMKCHTIAHICCVVLHISTPPGCKDHDDFAQKIQERLK